MRSAYFSMSATNPPMQDGGSSQSGGYCPNKAASYFSLSELLSGCRRYRGFGVEIVEEKRCTGEDMDDSEDDFG